MTSAQLFHLATSPVRPQLAAHTNNVKLNRYDYCIFLAPACQFVQLEVVGRLYLTEILLLLLGMLLLREGKFDFRNRTFQITLLLGALWLANQVATDLILGTPFVDYSRSWSRIGLFLINLVVIRELILRSRRGILLYVSGMITGGLLTYFLFPDAFATAYPWKFGFGFSVTWTLVLCSVWACYGRHRIIATLVLFGTAGLNGYVGNRSTAGVCLVSALFMIAQARENRGSYTVLQRTRLAAMLLGASYVSISGYGYLAGQGLLGDDARRKYETESAGQYGFLIGGRGVVLEAAEAIIDSPFIGHGSWSKNSEYIAIAAARFRDMGYAAMARQTQQEELPLSHSHLLGAWVEGGLFGGIFWLWVTWLALRTLLSLDLPGEGLTPIVIFVGVLLLWDIAFSPFLGDRKFITPFFMIVLIIAGQRSYDLNQRRFGQTFPDSGSEHL